MAKSINYSHLIDNSLHAVLGLMAAYYANLATKYNLMTADVKEKQKLINDIKHGFGELAKENSICLEVPYEQSSSLAVALSDKDFNYVKFFDPVTKNVLVVTDKSNKPELEKVQTSLDCILNYKNPSLVDDFTMFNARNMSNYEKLLFERMMQSNNVSFEETEISADKYKIANKDIDFVNKSLIPKLAAIMSVDENKNNRIAFENAEKIIKKISSPQFTGYLIISSPQNIVYKDSNVTDVSYYKISKNKDGDVLFSSEIKMDTGISVKVSDITIGNNESVEEKENKFAEVFSRLCAGGDIFEFKANESIDDINIEDISNEIIRKHTKLYYNSDKEETLRLFKQANKPEKKIAAALVAAEINSCEVIKNGNGEVAGFTGPLGKIYQSFVSNEKLTVDDLSDIKNERARKIFADLSKNRDDIPADTIKSIFSDYLGKIKLYNDKFTEINIQNER